MIDKFDGEYRFLSNFFFSQVYYEGIGYPTVEHAYQASKTLDFDKRKFISKISWNKAGQVKRMGQKLSLRLNWEDLKISIMEDLINQKFINENLKIKLKDTSEEELIEGNYWHDNFWGNCKCKKCIDKPGLNMLGLILMRRRDLL